jgi:hypothetical protein
MPGWLEIVPLISTPVRLADKGGRRLPIGLFPDVFSEPVPDEFI